MCGMVRTPAVADVAQVGHAHERNTRQRERNFQAFPEQVRNTEEHQHEPDGTDPARNSISMMTIATHEGPDRQRHSKRQQNLVHGRFRACHPGGQHRCGQQGDRQSQAMHQTQCGKQDGQPVQSVAVFVGH